MTGKNLTGVTWEKPSQNVGLRFYVNINGMRVAKLLMWIVKNMNYVVIPQHVYYDGVMSFSNAIALYCKSLDNSCIKTLYEKYSHSADGRTRPVKTIYATGHGIYMHGIVSVELHEIDIFPILSGVAYIIVDTYGAFNKKQAEFLHLIRKTPNQIRPLGGVV